MKPRRADHASNQPIHALDASKPAQHSQGQVVKAAPLALSAGMSVLQAFLLIVANCLDHIRGNEAGVASGDDPESVHQMRVGLRRLRSALRIFRDIGAPAPALLEEIDWLFAQLSELRDWDVLAEITLPLIIDGAENDASLDDLQKAVSAIARNKRRRASALIHSARFTTLTRMLNAWLEELDTTAAAPDRDESIRDYARRVLARERKRLHRHGKRLREGDAQARHRLRIAAKRTRYAHEFFASLYPGRRTKTYTVRLLGLLDCLGRLNDFSVAEHLLAELTEKRQNILVGASYARGYLAAETLRLCRTLDKRWKQLKHATPPAMLG